MFDLSVKVAILENSIISKNTKASYVYFCLKKPYIKNKKYNSDKRVMIGKVDPSDHTSIFSNENFKKLFPNEYESIKTDEKINDKIQFSEAIFFGQTALFHHLFKDTSLKDILKRNLGSNNFDDETTTNNVFNLACCFFANSKFKRYQLSIFWKRSFNLRKHCLFRFNNGKYFIFNF